MNIFSMVALAAAAIIVLLVAIDTAPVKSGLCVALGLVIIERFITLV